MKAAYETFPSGSVLIGFEPNDRFVYAFPGLPPTANRIWRSGSPGGQFLAPGFAVAPAGAVANEQPPNIANRGSRSGSPLPGLEPDPFFHAGRPRKARTHRAPDYVKWTDHRKADFFTFRAPAVPESGFAVDLVIWPPDRRRFDIDNRIKPALDMLTHAGVWEDDSAVSEVHAVRRPVIVKGGWTVIYARPAKKTPEAVSEIFWLPPEIWKRVIPKEEL